MDLLLKNGLVVTENECKRVDIAVKNGKIAGLLERGSKTCCSEKESGTYFRESGEREAISGSP